jgi:hypothetical protein
MGTRFSNVLHDRVEYSAWLAITEDGDLTLTRGRPALSPKQRAVSLTLTVPRAIFKTPEIRVAIQVADPGEAAIDIEAAAQTVAEAIAAGCDLKVTVEPAGLEP